MDFGDDLAELIDQAKEGNVKPLFERIKPYLYAMAYHWLDKNEHHQPVLDTDDLVSEAYVIIIETLPGFDPNHNPNRDTFKGWLGRVVNNYWIDYGRKLTSDWRRIREYTEIKTMIQSQTRPSLIDDGIEQEKSVEDIQEQIDKEIKSKLRRIRKLYKDGKLTWSETRERLLTLGYYIPLNPPESFE